MSACDVCARVGRATLSICDECQDEMTGKRRAPEWTCAACGSSGPFKDVKYDTPGEPVEYDMECQECGSLDARESAAEAASALGNRLFETHDVVLEEAARAVELAHMHSEGAPGRPCTCESCRILRAAVASVRGLKHESALALAEKTNG